MAVPVKIDITQQNDQVVEILGLQDAVSENFMNSAAVTATLKDNRGNPVAGFDGISLAFLSSSNGNYRGQVEETFNPPLGTGYTLVIDAVEASAVLHMEIVAEVVVRRR